MEISPNSGLKETYGSIDDPTSLLSQANVVAVRHAYSRANQFSENQQEQIKKDYPGISKSDLRIKKLSYHMDTERYPFMIDAEILEETIPLIERQT